MKSFSRNNGRQPHPQCGESMTEQSHEKACNINNIMAKYAKTGLIDHMAKHQAKYGDVSGADFKAAQDLVAEQKSAFHELPAEVRAEFDNDPTNYLDLVMTDEGVQELAAILNPDLLEDDDAPEEEPVTPSTPEKPEKALQEE